MQHLSKQYQYFMSSIIKCKAQYVSTVSYHSYPYSLYVPLGPMSDFRSYHFNGQGHLLFPALYV
jgi:hypothetical protein